MKWYQLKTTQVLQKLVSQTDGLNKTQRQERLMEHGENKIAAKTTGETLAQIFKAFYRFINARFTFCCYFKIYDR